jgi:hypothetical protein
MREALSIRKQAYGPDHPKVTEITKDYEEICQKADPASQIQPRSDSEDDIPRCTPESQSSPL